MKSYKCRAISGALAALLLLAGLSTPAWLPGTGTRALAASAPAPDLIIQSVSLSPETASIGDTMTFTVTIKNRGDLEAGDSQLACLIDEHPLTTSSVNSIEPGAVTIKTFTWKAQAGPHVFRAIIDSDGNIDESDESNNDKTCAFSVLAPDLAIDAISWTPVHPAVGDKVTFTITITNQGDKRAGISNLDLSIDGFSRGYHDIPGLEAGASVNDTYTWTAASGVHKVKAVADALNHVNESDKANNTSEATCATILPDLTITSVSASPTNIMEGTEVTFTAIIKNQGGSQSGPTGVTFYIDDSALDWVFLGSLGPGEIVTVNYTWIATGTGTPVFKATIDAENKIQESDETNNSRTLSLAPFLPDLTVQDITWSPSTPLINTPMSFTVTVKNQGIAASGLADLKFNIDNAYVFHGAVSPLLADTTTTIDFNWMTPLYPHTVKATIDESNVIKESNESNNTLTKSVTFTKLTPTVDLVLQNITCSPAKPVIGETMTLTLVIMNQGTSTASPSIASIYMDANLADSVYTNELDPGQTLTLNVPISLQGLPFKDKYRISANLDINNTLFETNETNNQKDMYFSIAAPDLIVQNINWSPEAPTPGDMVTFNVIVKNIGDARAGSSDLSYYVDKVFMGKHHIEDIEPGTTVTRSFTWTASKASFSFTAVIDEAKAVSEKDESNNNKTVVIPAPDLIIDSVTWSPENPVEIAPVTFTASIRNRGYSPAPRSLLLCYIDGAAPLSLDTGELSPGGTTTVTFVYSFLPGAHTIRLAADGNDAISESNESNNEKTIKFTAQPRVTSAPPSSANSSVKAEVKTPTSTTAGKTTPTPTLQTKTTAPVKDVAANITAPPPKWQSIIQNKLFIIGFAVVGIGAIGALLLLRKKASKKASEE